MKKRIELNCHAYYSKGASIISPEDLFGIRKENRMEQKLVPMPCSEMLGGLKRETMKEQALLQMKKLQIMEQPIKEFEEENKLNLSENGGMLYWLNDDEKKMVQDFEEQWNGLVYHIIHSFTNIGEIYNLLYVSKYTEEWQMDLDDIDNGECFAYVVNKTDPQNSEMGYIGIKPMNGGVVRTW